MPKKKKFTDQEIAGLKETFLLFDKDGDGTIDTNELENVLRKLGKNPTSTQIMAMIAEADADNSGDIDFDEFVNMMQNQVSKLCRAVCLVHPVFSFAASFLRESTVSNLTRRTNTPSCLVPPLLNPKKQSASHSTL